MGAFHHRMEIRLKTTVLGDDSNNVGIDDRGNM